MRFAFNLIARNAELVIELYDAASVSESGANPSCLGRLAYSKEKNRWVSNGLSLPSIIQRSDVLTVKKIAKANLDAMDEAIEEVGLSPLVFLRALIAQRSVQIVWDASTKKFRCVGTMTEGSDHYEAVGASLTVEAKDEDIAIRLAKKAVAERMAEKPEDAAKLAAFFSGGCKVKKIVSGKLPDYIKVESLASNSEEEKLAKTAVKIQTKGDSDE